MQPTESQPHVTPETAIAVMSRDIHYMKESLQRLEKLIGETVKNNISRGELEAVLKNLDNEKKEEQRDYEEYKISVQKALDDHETRLRAAQNTIIQIVTWGSAGLLILSIAQFIIGKFL